MEAKVSPLRSDNKSEYVGYAELYRLHAQMYQMRIADSEQIVDSVIAAIMEMMKRTDVLHLPNFGKFETRYRAPYQMVDNFPKSVAKHGEALRKEVPGKFSVKFVASPKFNAAAKEYFSTEQEDPEENEKAPE